MTNIITDLDQLRTPAEPLEFITNTGMNKEEGEQIIKQLKEVMENNPSILSLAAPQIGINKRIFCIRFENLIKIFINPIVTKKKGAIIAPETFSSMPGKEILISRPQEITVVYYTEEFKYEDNKLLDAAARIFDQQLQLLDGVLPDELGMVSDVEIDGSLADLSEDEINQLIEMYKQFITVKTKAFETEISKNEEETKQYKRLKFTEKVINGDIAVVEDPDLTAARARTKNKISNSMLNETKNKVAAAKAAHNAQIANLQKRSKHNKRKGK